MLEPEELKAIQDIVNAAPSDNLSIIIQGGAVGMMVVVLVWLIPKFLNFNQKQSDTFLQHNASQQELMMASMADMNDKTVTALNRVTSKIEENTTITKKLEDVLDQHGRSPTERTRASDRQEVSRHG